MSKKSKKRKRRVVFVGYYKLHFGSGREGGWEYYKRYSDGHYYYWAYNTWSDKKMWCWGGSWKERIHFRPATWISKLEMILVNGPESVKSSK